MKYILTLSCADTRGTVAAVSGFLQAHFCFIIESGQYGDESTGTFFMRVDFATEAGAPDVIGLREQFAGQVATPFAMRWEMADKAKKMRALLMVSEHGHCLNDVLYRVSTGQLALDIPLIVSNHETLEAVAARYGVPFHYVLVKGEGGKQAAEAELLVLIEKFNIDVVVLARYMQILSADLCTKLAGRAINIHHSFLPSFKGAKPYAQAYERGVKIIGATAHYVTTDLDEGPIIEQEVARVDHAHSVEELTAIGRDIECQVLARALRFHSEHRVLLNGKKTVVFR